MSKKRKSFIVHNDSLNILDELTDDQAGMLFKAIKDYQLGNELNLDTLTKIAFSPFIIASPYSFAFLTRELAIVLNILLLPVLESITFAKAIGFDFKIFACWTNLSTKDAACSFRFFPRGFPPVECTTT